MAAHMITNDVASRRNVHIYTFGSPRVGDKGFAYSYDRVSVLISILIIITVMGCNLYLGVERFILHAIETRVNMTCII